MRTKAVYVIIGNSSNIYCEQLFVSLWSLKYYNPSIKTAVIMDRETQDFMRKSLNGIFTLIDESVVVDFKHSYNPKYRSRYLKTNLSQYIDSDFIFFDTDTLVLGDLSEIDEINVNIGAVTDLHQNKLSDCRYISFIKNRMKLIGWPMFDLNSSYYNSGILLVKNNLETQSFFSEWHKNWLYGQSKGVYQDQLSLNYTNSIIPAITKLSPYLHCQLLGNGLNYFCKAKIVHYYNSSEGDNVKMKPFFLMEKDTLLKIREKGMVYSELAFQIINLENFFPTKIDLITGENIPIFYSTTYKLLSVYYQKYPFLFNLSEKFLFVIRSVIDSFSKKIKKLFRHRSSNIL